MTVETATSIKSCSVLLFILLWRVVKRFNSTFVSSWTIGLDIVRYGIVRFLLGCVVAIASSVYFNIQATRQTCLVSIPF